MFGTLINQLSQTHWLYIQMITPTRGVSSFSTLLHTVSSPKVEIIVFQRKRKEVQHKIVRLHYELKRLSIDLNNQITADAFQK